MDGYLLLLMSAWRPPGPLEEPVTIHAADADSGVIIDKGAPPHDRDS